MSWVKLDDQFADHPKVIEAGPLAAWLYVCGLTYCARYLTDGWIPRAQVRKLADVDNAHELADRLVSVGLWEEVDGGYEIHDYLGCAFGQDASTQGQRKTREYKTWRRAVLERDGYACANCGAYCCELHAHHIRPWARNHAGRLDVSNGVTLCRGCHNATHRRNA